jgi:peptidyl-tRNA hydrolase
MSNTRLTVVVRKDLNLPEGLLAAQAVHTSMEFIRDKIDAQNRMSEFDEIEKEWIKEPYISILAVQCHEDFEAVVKHAESEGLPYQIWEDTIPSPTFPDKAIKATVGLAIGPADFDAIKIVTNGLELY